MYGFNLSILRHANVLLIFVQLVGCIGGKLISCVTLEHFALRISQATSQVTSKV